MAHKFRCHNLADLMTEPKSKNEGPLSKGAKTAVRKVAREIVFGVRGKVESKAILKGLRCENDSIALVNRVFLSNFTKNEERRTNDWLSGEPDIVANDFGIDIKTSWSVDTFPLVPEEGEDKTYEWQCRAYMMLFDKPSWRVAYCLVDTPQDLIGYEDPAIHIVSHISPYMRVTQVMYERDKDMEDRIKEKVGHAQKYLEDLLIELTERYATFTGFEAGVRLTPEQIRQSKAKSDFSVSPA